MKDRSEHNSANGGKASHKYLWQPGDVPRQLGRHVYLTAVFRKAGLISLRSVRPRTRHSLPQW